MQTVKDKCNKGLTLVELIIAVAILAMGIGGIMTVMYVGLRQSTRANDLTIAGIEAQLQMESLVGRPWISATHPFPLMTLTNDAHVGWGYNPDTSTTGYNGWNTAFRSSCGDMYIVLKYRPLTAQLGHDIEDMGFFIDAANEDATLNTSGFNIGDSDYCVHYGDDTVFCYDLGSLEVAHLLTMEVRVYVFMDQFSAEAHQTATTTGFTVRHTNILNVHSDGRIG